MTDYNDKSGKYVTPPARPDAPESYRRYLGTKAYPTEPGLFEAISAGKVVADIHGCWVEYRPGARPAIPENVARNRWMPQARDARGIPVLSHERKERRRLAEAMRDRNAAAEE